MSDIRKANVLKMLLQQPRSKYKVYIGCFLIVYSFMYLFIYLFIYLLFT